MKKFFCWSHDTNEVYINQKQIETIDTDGDGCLRIRFTSGNVRLIGPFDKDEIGYVIDELTDDRFDPVNAKMC